MLSEFTVWTTTRCNLRCKYCFVYKLNKDQKCQDMTVETADQLIRFADKNLKPDGKIWFFGAEPLCNFDMIKYIVKKCKEKGYEWHFGATTNATLITEERAQWMKDNKFTLLCSVDGPKNSHDPNRIYANGKGSWDDAWEGLSFVRKYLDPNPQLRWTVPPSTVKGLAENIRKMVEDYGLTNLAVDFVYEVEWTPEDLAAVKKELEIFGGYYKTWMQQGKPVFSMFVRDANAATTLSAKTWTTRCGLGNGSVGIDYDGTIYPCHRFIDSHKIKIGDIYNGFYKEHSKWVENWRKIAPYCEDPKKCVDCNYKNACNGGCIAMNYDLFEDPHVNPETFCTLKQLITDVLGDLCKSLQDNPTFQKLYQRRPYPPQQGKPVQPAKKGAPSSSQQGVSMLSKKNKTVRGEK
jgi:uncharacterized protein